MGAEIVEIERDWVLYFDIAVGFARFLRFVPLEIEVNSGFFVAVPGLLVRHFVV